MKTIKCFAFAVIILPFLSGCNDQNKQVLLGNINKFTGNNELFVEGSTELIQDLIDTKLPFVVYLTSDSCSHCNSFTPIIEKWASKSNALIVKMKGSKAQEISESFNKLFHAGSYNDEPQIVFPTVGIVNENGDCDFVDNRKYMQQKHAFSNYMNRKYRVSTVYFTNEDILSKNVQSSYTYISFNNKDRDSINLYSDKILPLVKKAKKNCVISNFNSNKLEVSKKDENKNYFEETLDISSETSQNSLESYF